MVRRNSGRKYALFTIHALFRASSYGVSTTELCAAWEEAQEEYLSAELMGYKVDRYGAKALTDRFFWSEKYKLYFTVSVSRSGQWFIQTITNKKGSDGQ